MRTQIIAATAATFLMSGASHADPTGRYTVRGTNPGDSKPYTGQVLVARTGQTYQVLWSIGGQTYVGTGIGSADFLAVTYRAGPGIGLAIYFLIPTNPPWLAPEPINSPSAAVVSTVQASQ